MILSKVTKDIVRLALDVINMLVLPVVALPGKDHLKRAIDLYLECKSYSS